MTRTTAFLVALLIGMLAVAEHFDLLQPVEEQAGLIPTAHGYVAGGLDCGRH